MLLYVTVFWKIDLKDTNTEILFLPVDDSHTHALSKNQALETRWLGLLLQVAFFQRFQTMKVYFMACVAPEGL